MIELFTASIKMHQPIEPNPSISGSLCEVWGSLWEEQYQQQQQYQHQYIHNDTEDLWPTWIKCIN